MPEPITDPPAPTPAAPPQAPQSFDDLLGNDKTKQLTSDLTKIYEQKGKAESGLEYGKEKQLIRDRAEMEKAHQAESATLNDIKPWNADENMAKYSHSPMEEFGSFATMFSIAASAFTHTPATNAMNGAAAYMNAVNAGDEGAYNKAYLAFKENSELALKRAALEHVQFEEANKFLDTDMTIWRARTEAAAARFGNQKMLAFLKAGMDPEVIQMQESQAKAAAGMAEAFDRLTDSKLKMDYVNARMKSLPPEQQNDPQKHMQFLRDYEADQEAKSPEQQAYRGFVENYEAANNGQQPPTAEIVKFLKGMNEARYGGRGGQLGSPNAEIARRQAIWDDENASASPDDRSQAHDKIIRDVKEAYAPPITGNEKVKIDAHIRQYDLADDLIGEITDTLGKYSGAAGAAGKVTRAAEVVRDIFGSNDTDRKQMQRDIEQLQLMAPRLLLDQATGRPLSAEAGHVTEIIAGLNMGDTTANTMRAMQEVRDRLKKMRDSNAAELPNHPGVTIGEVKPAAPPQEWPGVPVE